MKSELDQQIEKFLAEETMVTPSSKSWGNVLFIDDDLDICNEISDGLRRNNYQARHIHVSAGMSATNLRDYIRKAIGSPNDEKRALFDLILWDINLGGNNNGPAIAMRVDDAMKEGQLNYALSEIYTGTDNTDQIRSMTAANSFFVDPYGYIKDGVMPVEKFAKILMPRINVARKARAHLRAIRANNEIMETLYQNIATVCEALSTIGLEHRCADELMPQMSLLEAGLPPNYKMMIKDYAIEGLVGDLGSIEVPRVINDESGKSSETVSVSSNQGYLQYSGGLLPLMRTFPAVLRNFAADMAMYTIGNYGVSVSSRDGNLTVALNMTMREKVDDKTVQEALNDENVQPYLKRVGCTTEYKTTERALQIKYQFPLREIKTMGDLV